MADADDDLRTFQRGGIPEATDPGAAGGAVRAPSPLEELEAEAQRDLESELEPLELLTPGRPGWAVRYRCDLEPFKVEAFEKRAADKKMPNGVDNVKHASLMLADQCEAILKDGQVVVDASTNEPLTFNHPTFQAKFNAVDAVSVIRAWFVRGGVIVSQAAEVLVGSGINEGGERVDPTQRSSTS